MLCDCIVFKRIGIVGNRVARPVGCRLFCCRRQLINCRYCCYLILLIISLPLLELLRRYHHYIWNFCPNDYITTFSSSAETAKCEIPKLNLWDPTILKYLDPKEHNIKPCAKDYPLVHLTWSPSTPSSPSLLQLTERGQKEISHLACVYQLITRNEDDKTVQYSKEHAAVFPLEMPGEIVQIVCREKSNQSTYYTDAFATVVPRKHSSDTDDDLKKKWSVLVIGIDAVSKQNYIRFLPKSFEWLTKNGLHVFDAYHKIGENTFPNLVPMLTGRKVELSAMDKENDLPHSGGYFTWIMGMPFDTFPLIWYDFSKAGYATAYTEDDPGIATFNMLRRGFEKQPTDHYGRPMFLSHRSYKDKVRQVNPGIVKFNATSGEWEPIESRYFCINGRRKYEVVWDYTIKQLISRYSPITPTFAFSWVNQLAHDWLTTLGQADQPILSLLKFLLEDKGYSAPWRNDTFIFLLSDHGQRVDKIRASFVGRLEDRLPFMAVHIPPQFKQIYPKMTMNFVENTKRLVTALDLYATFRHILHISTLNKATDTPGDFTDAGPTGFGISLFQQISSMRSCADAGIPEWHCACHRYTELNITSKEAISASNLLATTMAKQLGEANGLCAELSVAAVEQIRRVEYANSATHRTAKCHLFGLFKEAADMEDVFTEYEVQVTMKPGGGKFEANVRDNWRTAKGWEVVGTIERVNRYGNQSACLPESLRELRSLCFCI